MFSKTKPLLDWETDLQTQFTDAQWQQAITSIYKATTCTSLWLITQKTLMRWYLTLSRLAKFHKHASHDCWRNCGHTGTLLHILWSCPNVTQLWKNVESILQDILHSSVTITPHLAILNLTIEDFPIHQRTVITHVLLATKLLITRNWKSDNIPSLTEVTNLVQTHFTYETLLSRSKQSHTKTLTRWNPWVLWYSKKELTIEVRFNN